MLQIVIVRRVFPALVCLSLGCCLSARTVEGSQKQDPIARSYEFEAKGNLSSAIHAMQEASESAPDDYFPRLRLAYLELCARDYRAAAANYSRAARIAPNAIEPLLGWQQALNLQEAHAEAEPVGRKALALDPNNYLAASRLAWALYKLKRYGESAKLYRMLNDAYPADIEMRLGYAFAVLGAGNTADAKASFHRVLAMVPGQPRAKSGLLACP